VLYTDFIMPSPERLFYSNFNALFGNLTSMTLAAETSLGAGT
jgi:hypothetical protein